MRHIPFVVAGLVGLVAGVFVARIPGIKVQPTIDLDGLVALLIGLILFLGINLLYQSQSAVSHGEKEIIVKLAQDALLAAERIDATFTRWHRQDPLPPGAVEEIQHSLQRYNNAIHTLARALKACKKLKTDRIDLGKIQELREEYRAVLTESPFPRRYEPGASRQAQRHQLAVREALIDVILDLNRL